MPSTRPLKVLLVAEDQFFLGAISHMLTAAGHAVVSAGAARDGLVALKNEPVDVLVCDGDMEDFTGAALAEIARLRYPRLPIVVAAATPPDPVPERVAIVSKPFKFEDFLETIETAVASA